MIKVCHVTSVHPKEDVRIFHKECISLAGAGYDVYLVQQGDSYEKDGVHLIGFGQMAKNRLERMFHSGRKAYKVALEVDADIYHLHDPELLPYARKLKKKGKKVIFDSHEKYTEQIAQKPYLPQWAAKLISWGYGCYERFVLRRIDAVIFPCTLLGVDPFDGLCKRHAIISNAAVLGEFYNQYDPQCTKIPGQVCYVGSLTRARGITEAIIGAQRAGAVLALAGNFSPESYASEVEQMPEYAAVHYLGQMDLAGVRELLGKSQAGLCTLLDCGQYQKLDTFGIKVFEYMSMALPVILSHSPYNDRMIEKYQFGICVNPSDPDDIARAIAYLREHPQEAKQMGENGRKAVMEEFNWGVEEKKLFALYEDILKK